jgi:hypothetical protein
MKGKKIKTKRDTKMLVIGAVLLLLSPLIGRIIYWINAATCPIDRFGTCEFNYSFQGAVIAAYAPYAWALVALAILINGIYRYVKSKNR